MTPMFWKSFGYTCTCIIGEFFYMVASSQDELPPYIHVCK
jgi:hypothetical protein